MGKVIVEGVKSFAYHGCMDIEAKVGTWFETTLVVSGDLSLAAQTDRIDDAIDYVALTNVIHAEMAQRSNLIEHVAQRIVDEVRTAYPQLTEIQIEVKKLNAPVSGEVKSVGVCLSWP